MFKKSQPAQRREIRHLLTVISSGVLGAFLLSGFLLYYYSPTGRYLAKNVLLSPVITSQIYFTDTNPITGTIAKYVFEGAEYSFYDDTTKQLRTVKLPAEKYQQFYDLVGDERSLATVSPEVESLFNKTHTATLALKVHADTNNALIASSKTLMTVVFAADSDYYRVQLREHGPTGGWAYYYHPQIYRKAMQLFTESP
jgi:hypothetical protein